MTSTAVYYNEPLKRGQSSYFITMDKYHLVHEFILLVLKDNTWYMVDIYWSGMISYST